MKTISIGDLHGHDSWKKVIPIADNYHKIIFIADYVDEFDFEKNCITIDNDRMRENLLEIIEFKKANPAKAELLIGNHDAGYMYFPDPYYRCEGFRPEAQPDLSQIFYENRSLFKIAYQHKNYLWTHAGLSNKFYQELKMAVTLMKENMGEDMADMLNYINETGKRTILHQKGSSRLKYGSPTPINGGITWADRSETNCDYLDGYHQIVGHTPISRNTTIEYNGSSITYIDSLGSEGGGFYELEIKD